MGSLKTDFHELCEQIKRGMEFSHAGFEPIYYLVFPPVEMLNVKRQTAAWIAKLQNDYGWKVDVFSVADAIESVLREDSRWKLWLLADEKNPVAWRQTNESLANALTATGSKFTTMLENRLTALEGTRKALLLITDLEALHPYLRIGSIEANLQSKFHVPTVFLYPGERAGKTSLKFLGFYPEDGNYRSVHIGG